MRYALSLCLLLALVAGTVTAQTEADVAIQFFQSGGAYCVRLAPEATDLSDETEWTVMLFTSAANQKLKQKLRDMEPGKTGLRGQELTNAGLAVTGVWRRDRMRDEFFTRFAEGIREGRLQARVTKVAPPGLAVMKPRERAELYLKLTDRGLSVDFEQVAKLEADEFLAFQSFVPD